MIRTEPFFAPLSLNFVREVPFLTRHCSVVSGLTAFIIYDFYNSVNHNIDGLKKIVTVAYFCMSIFVIMSFLEYTVDEIKFIIYNELAYPYTGRDKANK